MTDTHERGAGGRAPAARDPREPVGPSDPPRKIVAEHAEEPSEELQQLMGELEAEYNFRRLVGPLARLVSVIAVALALFHLYTAGFGVLDNFRQRAVHIGGILILIFLLYPFGKRSPKT